MSTTIGVTTDPDEDWHGCEFSGDAKSQAVAAVTRQHCRHDQRAEHGARLVECLVEAEHPALSAELLSCVGEHDVARRIADRLAGALENDQNRRGRPAIDQRESWNGGHLHDITEDGDRPEPPGRIGEAPRDQAKGIAQQFAKACNDTNDRAARLQRGQKWTEDAA
jgi:hypothetical protein